MRRTIWAVVGSAMLAAVAIAGPVSTGWGKKVVVTSIATNITGFNVQRLSIYNASNVADVAVLVMANTNALGVAEGTNAVVVAPLREVVLDVTPTYESITNVVLKTSGPTNAVYLNGI